MRAWRIVAFLILVAVGLLYAFALRDDAQGRKRRLDARNYISATIDGKGLLHVSEDLTLDVSQLADSRVERVLPHPRVRVVGVSDSRGAAIPFTTEGNYGSVTTVGFVAPAGGHQRFVIRYVVERAVGAYADAAHLFTMWVDRSNELAFENLGVEVTWANASPPRAATGMVRPEPLGPLSLGQRRAVLDGSAGKVSWDAGRVGANSEVDTRVVFSLAAVPGLSRAPRPILDAVRSAEDQRVVTIRRSRTHLVGLNAFAALLAVSLLTAWSGLQYLLGREPRVDHPGYEREPPSTHPPAEVGWLVRYGEVWRQDLVGTILDLAYRGHLQVNDRDGHTFLVAASRGRQRDRLRRFEEEVLQWVFPEGTDEVRFSDRAAEMLRADLDASRQTVASGPEDELGGFSAVYRSFANEVASAGEADGLVERKAGAKSVFTLRLVGLGALATGVVFTGYSLAAVALIVAGALMTAFGGALTRRTPKGAALAGRWEAFARYLRDYSFIDDAPPASVVLWDSYLPYAVVLGQADEVVRRMSRVSASQAWQAVAAVVGRPPPEEPSKLDVDRRP